MVTGMLCALPCGAPPPPLELDATTTMAITALAPTSAKPVRGNCAARTPAERPGFSGPVCAGRVEPAASAACAEGPSVGQNKAAARIAPPVVKCFFPPVRIPKRLFHLPI